MINNLPNFNYYNTSSKVSFEGLPPVKIRDFQKYLKKHGGEIVKIKSRNHDQKAVLGEKTVPIPSGKEIKGTTLKDICAQLRIPYSKYMK